MSVRMHLLWAMIGWLAGIGITLGVGFVIFPALTGADRAVRSAPDLLILGIVMLVASPAALAGGLMGGRLSQEGGHRSQLVLAAILGSLFALPFSCAGFWYTGW